ncbi:O-antigen ligase family protein [Methylobacterium sp. J-090]|uniref:O-antigen ligase family protein n=1 Tax=Methylobacterium sp. J-090 TaxID=2836666 RepID=UPI001FBA498F|nr:O-antigen ligase family protein [Methylobacterium sp. J-090]MCJ2083456.1 O-antigen ligase family protein [Methylobacterium sp. J-090]
MNGAVATPPWSRRAATGPLHTLGYILFGLFIFFTCFTFMKPSPYDFLAPPTILLWFLLDIRIHRATLIVIALLAIYLAAILVSLIPYLDESLPVEWTYQTVYLGITGIFFVMFFSDDTARRVTFGLKAYLAGCLFAAICGILSYFDVVGESILFKMDGRASGVFQDPNLLGSFLILSALYLIRGMLVGETRRVFLSATALLVILACVFLSFSRGSWGACVVGIALTIGLTWATSPSRAIRRRIARLSALALVVGAVLIGGLLSVDSVAERFTDRAQVTKDYDEGETGRFGNQRRGIPMLIDRPLGFGPLRWRRIFDLEPHNTYIGGFANGGWLGGFAFISIVLTTTFVGFRLCLKPSPYQGLSQVVFPALLMFFLQAFQIDIEKWRHVYMMLGMVWGLEVARLAWLAGQRDAGAAEFRIS